MRIEKTWAAAAAGTAAALLAAAALAQGSGFRFFGPLSRVITPNGDAINDSALVCFDNPQDSDVSGRIYSLLGHEVASFEPRRSVAAGTPPCPAGSVIPSQYLRWDGSGARGGIYVYRVQAEGKVYSGTLVVVK